MCACVFLMQGCMYARIKRTHIESQPPMQHLPFSSVYGFGRVCVCRRAIDPSTCGVQSRCGGAGFMCRISSGTSGRISPERLRGLECLPLKFAIHMRERLRFPLFRVPCPHGHDTRHGAAQFSRLHDEDKGGHEAEREACACHCMPIARACNINEKMDSNSQAHPHNK